MTEIKTRFLYGHLGLCVSTALRAVAVAAIVFAAGGSPGAQPEPEFSISTGSGFVLTSSGYIATNNHVVAGATKLEVRVPGRSAPVPGIVLAKDVENDLAIVKVQTSLGNTPISFADMSQVKVGQDTFVLGYPLGDIMGATVRLSTGTLSSMFGVQDDPRVYQIGNPIQPGNSGGPVFNKDGQVVGIVVSGLDASKFLIAAGIVPQNVNFAVKGALLQKLLQTLPDGPDALRRNTKISGTREQQVATLSPWVVEIVNYRATITDAAREFRRSPSATMRVDLLGGRLAFYVDPAKWQEIAPKKAGDPQEFQLPKSEHRVGLFIERFPAQSSIDALKAEFLKRLRSNFRDASIDAQQRRTVNGLPLLAVQIGATTATAPIVFLTELYTSPEGAVALAAYADTRAMEKAASELEELLSGVEKPANPAVRSAPYLTEWTRRTIRRLDSPVLIRVFAPEPEFSKFQNILTPYQDASPSIFVEYVDPYKSPAFVKAMGVEPSPVPTIDAMYKGRFVRTGGDSETHVTTSLARLAAGPQKMYFTYVHGERDLGSTEKDGYSEMARLLDLNNFSAERLFPTSDNSVPADAAAVIVAGPKRDFTANQIAMLKKYLASGGRLLLLIDPPGKRNGAALPNLVGLAREWGVDIGDAGVKDRTGKGLTIGSTDGLGIAVTGKPTAVAPGADPNVVSETRLAVVGDADVAANGAIKEGTLNLWLSQLLYWVSEPIPPSDRSK